MFILDDYIYTIDVCRGMLEQFNGKEVSEHRERLKILRESLWEVGLKEGFNKAI